MNDKPTWYAGTKQCVQANLHFLQYKKIDSQKCQEQIMAHIQTLLETEIRKEKYKGVDKL